MDDKDNTDNGVTRDNAELIKDGDTATTSDPAEREVEAVAGQEPQGIQADTSEREGMDGSGRAEDPYEGAVPPGYDWPTHGGYLGCLMGVVTLSIIGTLVAAPLLALLTYTEVVPLPIAWLVTALVFLACLIGGGRLGWALGKRFYREYPHERPTWGESDEAEFETDETEENTDTSGETTVRR